MPRHLEYLRIGEERDSLLLSRYTNQTVMYCLPPNLKTNKDYFPELRHICLYWFLISWDCGRLRGLKTLIIHGSDEQVPMTADNLIGILKASPGLELLEMRWGTWENDLGDSAEGGDFRGTSIATLPCLRLARLDFRHSHHILPTLRRVGFSPEAQVWIHATHTFTMDATELVMKAALAALEQEWKPLGR